MYTGDEVQQSKTNHPLLTVTLIAEMIYYMLGKWDKYLHAMSVIWMKTQNCSSCSLTKKQQRHCGTQKLLVSFIAIAIVKEQFMLYVFLKTFT